VSLFLSCITQAKTELPLIIPHRGGKAEFPENTIYAFSQMDKLKMTIMEIDVQVTKDGTPVIYHPADLSVRSNLNGKISDYSYSIIKTAKIINPTNINQKLYIPSLHEVLTKFKNITFIIDLKSLPAKKLIDSIAKTLEHSNAWNRVIFYSTDISHYHYLKKNYKLAKIFEARDHTRDRNLNMLLNESCSVPLNEDWIGLELKRKIIIKEYFALGEGTTSVTAKLWNPEITKCINNFSKNSKIVVFGINNIEDYCESIKLGAYAVLSDYPTKMTQLKQKLENEGVEHNCSKINH
jgi:glycerophosphoryl diester phosphodiesterase